MLRWFPYARPSLYIKCTILLPTLCIHISIAEMYTMREIHCRLSFNTFVTIQSKYLSFSASVRVMYFSYGYCVWYAAWYAYVFAPRRFWSCSERKGFAIDAELSHSPASRHPHIFAASELYVICTCKCQLFSQFHFHFQPKQNSCCRCGVSVWVCIYFFLCFQTL